MAAIEFDARDPQCVWVTFPEEWGQLDMHGYFNETRAHIARGRHYVMVVDLSQAGLPEYGFQAGVIDFIKEVEDESARLCKASAVIVSSSIIRLALSAILKLVEMPNPMFIVQDEAEAREKLHEALIEARQANRQLEAS